MRIRISYPGPLLKGPTNIIKTMDAQAVRQWGTTPPISTILPTEKELSLNDMLVAELKRQNNFEAPSDTEKRLVLGHQPLA